MVMSGRGCPQKVPPSVFPSMHGCKEPASLLVYTSAMQEMSKATKRRYNDPTYHLWYYNGVGLDIGGGDDPLGRWCHAFARMKSCRTWDKADGDAQKLLSIADNSLDFVTSSHCLEHLNNPRSGLSRWVAVVKPGGYLVVTVPDFNLYENGTWPSKYNADHKWGFALNRPWSLSPPVINVIDLIQGVEDHANIERLQLVRDFYSPHLAGTDQTLLPNVESAIEFVLRKHG